MNVSASQGLVRAIDRVRRPSLLVGVLALAACAAGWFLAPDAFLRAYLFGFVFFAGLSLGCLAIVMLQHLTGGAVVANALQLPLADGSMDVVMCSQLLHHFEEADAMRAIAELHRVSRRYVIVCDLQRSWFAAAGWRLASRALHFHEVTQRDGVTSVMRGFTVEELRSLVVRAARVDPIVRRGLFWRLSATWRKEQSRTSGSDSAQGR